MTPTRLHPIMLAGTGSDVGKSIIATALCRILLQDGYHPAPFKAQNMALNSGVTPDGKEIGRAQLVQAQAARVVPTSDMNPLLLKPCGHHTSQVILNGEPVGNQEAYSYFRQATYRQQVHQAYDRLAAQYHPIVMEGAGSISELNLRDHDIVNLPMARYAGARVILVADIDRGGVFASCYGSIMLQSPEDKALIRGIIVNKFRGDLRLFQQGREMLQQVCGVPVLGVIPYYEGIHIEAEDSVALQKMAQQQGKQQKEGEATVSIAVLQLPHLSNFTDFDHLSRHPRVNLRYTLQPQDIAQADIIILPGTKNTLADLQHLQSTGLDQAILQAHHRGARIVGICGGYQMMGQHIEDPEGIEGDIPQLPGLGLLPTLTTMQGEKVSKQVHFTLHRQPCQGYEIHQGRTQLVSPLQDGQCILQADSHNTSLPHQQGCVLGTYIHGLLDNQAVIDWLLQPFGSQSEREDFSYEEYKQQQYDLLAQHVRSHLDMDKLYEIMGY